MVEIGEGQKHVGINSKNYYELLPHRWSGEDYWLIGNVLVLTTTICIDVLDQYIYEEPM